MTKDPTLLAEEVLQAEDALVEDIEKPVTKKQAKIKAKKEDTAAEQAQDFFGDVVTDTPLEEPVDPNFFILFDKTARHHTLGGIRLRFDEDTVGRKDKYKLALLLDRKIPTNVHVGTNAAIYYSAKESDDPVGKAQEFYAKLEEEAEYEAYMLAIIIPWNPQLLNLPIDITKVPQPDNEERDRLYGLPPLPYKDISVITEKSLAIIDQHIQTDKGVALALGTALKHAVNNSLVDMIRKAKEQQAANPVEGGFPA
jgi:hypothetical protein